MQRKTGALSALVIAGVVASGGFMAYNLRKASAEETSGPQGRRTPVLVELFTSEGCSSCPSADKALASLIKSQPVGGAQIIALGEHVDYWNRLGWKDPFSSAAFTDRQGEYARSLRLSSVYTPQMVVDGRTEFVGSDTDRAEAAIAQAARVPKARVVVSRAESGNNSHPNTTTLQVQIETANGAKRSSQADVFLAITEDNLSSSVRSGENSGRTLDHVAVVRVLDRIGTLPDHGAFSSRPAVTLVPGWKQKNLHAVVFVQDRLDRRIVGAGTIALSP